MLNLYPMITGQSFFHASRPLMALVLAVGMTCFGCSSGDEATAPTASINGGESTGELAATTDSAGATPSNTPVQPAATDVDPMHPEVLIKTSLGDIKVQLDRENSPVTVNNFLNYADSGHYNDTLFHQVIGDFIVLGGGYDEQYKEKPTNFPIRNEADNGQKNNRGTISMARQPDVIASSTSQFFINVADNSSLDHESNDAEGYGYCVFGKVIAGMDVVDKIAKTAVTDRENFGSTPSTPIVIQSVTRAR